MWNYDKNLPPDYDDKRTVCERGYLNFVCFPFFVLQQKNKYKKDNQQKCSVIREKGTNVIQSVCLLIYGLIQFMLKEGRVTKKPTFLGRLWFIQL